MQTTTLVDFVHDKSNCFTFELYVDNARGRRPLQRTNTSYDSARDRQDLLLWKSNKMYTIANFLFKILLQDISYLPSISMHQLLQKFRFFGNPCNSLLDLLKRNNDISRKVLNFLNTVSNLRSTCKYQQYRNRKLKICRNFGHWIKTKQRTSKSPKSALKIIQKKISQVTMFL